jgi:phosphatidylinositol alpha-1,6-mannosyltransferase
MSSKPAMLALVTAAFGGRGGIAQHNCDFLGALVDDNTVSSITVLPRHAPDEVCTPPRIMEVPLKHARYPFAVAALRLAVARKFGVVYCDHIYMAPLAAMVARLCGAKLVVQMHGIEAWSKPSPFQRAAVEGADLILCVSRFTRNCVLSWGAVSPERALVLPCTIRDIFCPGPEASLRADLGLCGKRILLTVSRLDSRERYKGHDRVIAAMTGVLRRGHDVVYLVLGEGDDQPRLETLAREMGVRERIHFLGGVKIDALVAAYRSADLFVMPSIGEGFGIAFLEAMASGTPALGLAAAGSTDALSLGRAVPDAELEDAIVRALEQPPHPDPQELAAAVRRRFGREVFKKRASAALLRLWEMHE